MCENLKYIHSHDIVHLDLKLENMLLCYDLTTVKICDMESSYSLSKLKEVVRNNEDIEFISTVNYAAPEILT